MYNFLRYSAHALRRSLYAFSPKSAFQVDSYTRHNARRLEHLTSLALPLAKAHVFEVGAGIGDLTHFFLDRGCTVTCLEPRQSNLSRIRKRYPGVKVIEKDILSSEGCINKGEFQVVFCYGLLYHVDLPESALRHLSHACSDILLLETCVSFGEDEIVSLVNEPKWNPTQAYSGVGCRPTRRWIFNQLKKLFEYVYIPKTQPNHQEFPLDWNHPEYHTQSLSRAVFVASRTKLHSDQLTDELISQQVRSA